MARPCGSRPGRRKPGPSRHRPGRGPLSRRDASQCTAAPPGTSVRAPWSPAPCQPWPYAMSEQQYGTGPGNLWASGDRSATTELKTGYVTRTIAKKYLDHLGGSVRGTRSTHRE